jgi:hypothetical protein
MIHRLVTFHIHLFLYWRLHMFIGLQTCNPSHVQASGTVWLLSIKPKLHQKTRQTSDRSWKCSGQVTGHLNVWHKMMSTSVTHLCIPIHEGGSLHLHYSWCCAQIQQKISHTYKQLYPYSDVHIMWAVDGTHQASAVSLFVPPWHQGLYQGVKSVSNACNQLASGLYLIRKHLSVQRDGNHLVSFCQPDPDWLRQYSWEVMDFPPHISLFIQNNFHCAKLINDV